MMLLQWFQPVSCLNKLQLSRNKLRRNLEFEIFEIILINYFHWDFSAISPSKDLIYKNTLIFFINSIYFCQLPFVTQILQILIFICSDIVFVLRIVNLI